MEGRRRDFAPFAKLPPWPLDPKQKAPAIVIGEVHHPVEAREIFSPSWLTIPERGLYTGVAIFGAVGSGKTSACMNPFARQLLGWQAANPQMRAAALVLEVKGDFNYTWGGAAKEAQKPKAAKKPEAEPEPDDKTPDPAAESNQAATSIPPATGGAAPISQHLPPLFELIEQGKVLALNMPAGINPALARAVGVMLKNAWLQALLMRPAKMKRSPGRYFRPAVFICDEYQAFASVGEDDPSGDEKSFALTRQCRCIPIVATQSISSLRAMLGSSEAWRSLLQTLRTRIFLSLSDDASAKIASELCGQVAKIKESYTISETSKRSEVSPLSGRAGGGGGSMGATKSFREQREAVFHPRDFALLSNCQAICLPYDGAQSLEPRRVYLKPHYLPAEHSYWESEGGGPNMSAASGLEHLKPFLPGLESALEDSEVSEIMINGPGNVWVERAGRLTAHAAPDLDEAALERAAIHIARPLGLDPASSPIVDARLDDGSRVAICVPPASPQVAITVRRFGKRAFSADDLVKQGALPKKRAGRSRAGVALAAQHPSFRRHRIGQDHVA